MTKVAALRFSAECSGGVYRILKILEAANNKVIALKGEVRVVGHLRRSCAPNWTAV